VKGGALSLARRTLSKCILDKEPSLRGNHAFAHAFARAHLNAAAQANIGVRDLRRDAVAPLEASSKSNGPHRINDRRIVRQSDVLAPNSSERKRLSGIINVLPRQTNVEALDLK
jgi:hypothetical protein